MPSPVPLIPLEVGGSNYPMYSVGEYLASPTEDTWFTPGNMRPVIGTFDLDPGTVEQQLRSMYANGQRKIALVLWCDDFTPDARIRDIPVYGHVVNSKLGRLLPTHEANLRRILGLLREVGYDELSFRFATQGSADPRSWTSWDEGRYGNTWSFVSTTRAIIEEVLGPGPVQVAYDLDVELGGIDDGQAREYVVRLWRDYTRQFGSGRTVAFSIAVAPGRIAKAISAFDVVGIRPAEYAVDVYGNELQHLTYISQELKAAREEGKPIVLQEAYYNDDASAAEVKQARERLRLNIRTLFQWPLTRGAPQNHFSMHYPPEFSNYRGALFQ